MKENLKNRKTVAVLCLPYLLITLITASLFMLESPVFSQEEESLGRAADYEAMIPVKVIRTIELPEKGYHEGLLLEGGHIWVNNGEGGKTWVIDPAFGDKVGEIEPVGTFTEGITHAPGGGYWVTDWDAKKLYRVKIEENRMIAESEVLLAPSHPAGVIWNGSHLYVIAWTRGVGTKYHLLKMDKDCNILQKIRIKKIPEPSQLAWDGKNLWISSWFNRRVYKIDIKSLEIKGYFRSRIENTTGIAYDGKYFWATGTRADLYQIELQ